jgi:hypothetical protein
MRHSFTGERVNMQGVEDQAHTRMFAHEPESTIVHYHPADQACDSTVEHKLYDHLVGVIARYDVGIDLPDEYKSDVHRKSAAMSDNWFRNSGG